MCGFYTRKHSKACQPRKKSVDASGPPGRPSERKSLPERLMGRVPGSGTYPEEVNSALKSWAPGLYELRSHRLPRGSKYPIFQDFGPKDHFKSESSNIGYLEPLG